MKKHQILMFVFMSHLLLTACGGGGGSDDDDVAGSSGYIVPAVPDPSLTGSYQYLGFITLEADPNPSGQVSLDWNFLQLTELQDVEALRYSVPQKLDTCSLFVTDRPSGFTGQVIGFPNVNFTLVSPGETLRLLDDRIIYAEVDLSPSGREFNIAPKPVPDPLTFDLPSESSPSLTQVFPSFSDVIVPRFQRVFDLPNVVSADTTITWTPTPLADDTILLAESSILFPPLYSLQCHVKDDGEFRLPDNIVSALNDILGVGFELEYFDQVKKSTSMVVHGDAILLVEMTEL